MQRQLRQQQQYNAAMRFTHDYLEKMLVNEAMQQELERRIEAIVERKLSQYQMTTIQVNKS